MEVLEFHIRIMKIMQILKFETGINTKTMKICLILFEKKRKS